MTIPLSSGAGSRCRKSISSGCGRGAAIADEVRSTRVTSSAPRNSLLYHFIRDEGKSSARFTSYWPWIAIRTIKDCLLVAGEQRHSDQGRINILYDKLPQLTSHELLR